MAKPELGTKRQCGSCGAKFYDLGKDPIICPKCETVFQVTAVASRARPPEPAAGREAAAAAAAKEEETLVPETQDAEFVSLEDADAETQGAKKPEHENADADEDVELEESLDDAAFIEEQEEEDADVTDIIGDVNDEEES